MGREQLVAVVDDDDAFRVALVECLVSLGYGARGFASAEEFIAVYRTERYGCVITDIHMPGMSGFDLTRRLSAHSQSTPVIMVTAHLESELEAKAAAIGVVCLLRKPFKTDALTDCLEKAMNASRQL